MNPAQPYNEKNGRQVFPPQIGNVSEHDTASFNALIPLAKTILPVDCKFVYGKKQVTLSNRTGYYELYAVKDDNNKMEVNSCLEKIEAADDERGRPCIRLRFNALGTKIWARMTTKNVNRDIAMVIDDMVYSAPRVSGPIEGGNSMISGIFSDEEARMTTGMISAGYLPLHLRVVAIKVLPDKK